jgi:hypothetical protein
VLGKFLRRQEAVNPLRFRAVQISEQIWFGVQKSADCMQSVVSERIRLALDDCQWHSRVVQFTQD